VAPRSALKRFWRDDSGATAVEVGLLVALIAIAIISATTLLSTNIQSAFNKISAVLGS
jgi:pilus assembly protein Flp/PilA